MNAELILVLTALVLVIPAIVIIYGVLPPRRKPFMVDLLNATFGRGSTAERVKADRTNGLRSKTVLSKRAVLQV